MSERDRDPGNWTYDDALLAYKAYVDATMARMRADLTLAISRLRRAIAQARWRVPGSCERCGLLLANSTNLNADAVCDDCDAELRAGKLYGCDELSETRRRELGYGGG